MPAKYNPEKDKFIHYPRTGGRSVKKWLEQTFDVPLPTKMEPALGQKKNCWGTIRNPFDFYASYYFLPRKRPEWFVDFLRDFFDGKIEYYWLIEKFMKTHDIGVATYCFIYFFCDWEKAFGIKPIEDLKPYIIMDKIIKYEPDLVNNIRGAFDLEKGEILALLGTKPIGVSENKYNFMDYYNKEARDLVLHKDRLLFKLYPEYLPK